MCMPPKLKIVKGISVLVGTCSLSIEVMAGYRNTHLVLVYETHDAFV